jgi:hypothetical protein
MAINTGTHPKLLWPGIKAIWGQVYNEHAAEYPDLYEQDDSQQAYEQFVGLTGFGLAPIKPEGQAYATDTEVQGGITTMVPIAYALGYAVTKEELADNLYAQVASRRAKANAFSMAQTIEYVAAFLYNNAFSTTYYTLWDGKALCATDHTNVTGGTWSNELDPAAALSESSLEDALIQIMQFKNDRNLNINVMPKSLHVAPAEHFNAQRILKSTLTPGSSDNAINVLNATGAFPGGAKVNHYFTSPRAWFIRTNSPEGMKMLWRCKPEFEQDNDFQTKNALASAYMRLAVGGVDARGILGSVGP